MTLNRFSSTVYPGGLFGGTRLIYGCNLAVISYIVLLIMSELLCLNC